MTLSEFWDELNRHDWYYHFSDDHGVWSAGERHARTVKAISETSPDHKALFDAFGAHYFGGPSFGRPESPKPARPVDSVKPAVDSKEVH